MKSFKYSTQLFIASVITTLLLSSCGGGGSSNTGVVNNSNHPKFLRNKVTESPRYAPSGEINQTMPTFSWSAIENATYYRFGHESTDDGIDDWHEYTLTSREAGCHSKGDTCLFTPTDYTFPFDIEKVWWVQAEINGQWQDWSRPNVFTVVDSGSGHSGDVPQPITPVGTVSTLTPEFTWSDVNGAVTYKLGFENIMDEQTNGDSWKSYEISASNCHSGVCSFTPSNPEFYQGENVAWWVKAEDSNGSWSDWSEAAKFNISQQQTQTPFIFNITLDSNVSGNHTKNFTIAVQETGDYNVDCDSDGNLEAQHISGNYVCKYDNYGTHKITISGLFKGLRLIPKNGSVNYSLKKFEVLQWGSSRWASMYRAFADRTNRYKPILTKVIFSAQDTPNLSKPNFNMSEAFFNNSSFNSNINNWDVSNVTNMASMFHFASSFNQNIGNWDVSSVTNMYDMFSGRKTLDSDASAFNQDLSNWDVSNVTNMAYMFSGAVVFNQDLSNWDVSYVTRMDGMFEGAYDGHGNYGFSAFNQDISNWDVSNVTGMKFMFAGAVAFNQDISNWDVSNVTNMESMFNSAAVFNQDLSNWDVSHVTRMNKMFEGASSFNSDLSNWDVSHVTRMDRMFEGAVAFSSDISNWDVSNVREMGGMFYRASVSHYDDLLIKWSKLDLWHGVFFSAGNTQYSSAAANARDKLIDDFGWNILDGGQR